MQAHTVPICSAPSVPMGVAPSTSAVLGTGCCSPSVSPVAPKRPNQPRSLSASAMRQATKGAARKSSMEGAGGAAAALA